MDDLDDYVVPQLVDMCCCVRTVCTAFKESISIMNFMSIKACNAVLKLYLMFML